MTELILEVIKRILKVVALLDDIPFDSRKRLFGTALRGQLGKDLKDSMLYLLSSLGEVEDLLTSSNKKEIFINTIEHIVDQISSKAKSQNYRVGLNKIDRKQIKV